MVGQIGQSTETRPMHDPVRRSCVDDFSIPDSIAVDHVALRPPATEDVGELVVVCDDPDIGRWTRVPHPYGPDDAHAFVSLAALARREQTGAYFVIVDQSDALLGTIGLTEIDHEGLTAELGYLLAAPARGRGVATRAVAALVDWGFSAGLCRIQAHVLVGNDSSCRLLSRVGFVEEGVLRSMPADSCGVGLDRVDMHLFSRIRSDRD